MKADDQPQMNADSADSADLKNKTALLSSAKSAADSVPWSAFAQQNFAALVLVVLFLILHATNSPAQSDILAALFIALQIRGSGR